MCSIALLPETHRLTKVGWASRNCPPDFRDGFLDSVPPAPSPPPQELDGGAPLAS